MATTINMAITYEVGLKSEEIRRLALDGYEKAPGNDDEDTKKCARNLNILLETMGRFEDKQELEKTYPESGL